MTLVKVNNPQKGRMGFGLSPLFDEAFNDFVNGGNSLRSLYNKHVAVNIHETEKSFNIDFAAPGFDKADFKINLENNTLTVSAEKKAEEETPEEDSDAHSPATESEQLLQRHPHAPIHPKNC